VKLLTLEEEEEEEEEVEEEGVSPSAVPLICSNLI
jgi:hypothetical protein